MPRYISPQPQYFTNLGIPLTGGKLFFYEPSTLIPKNTYSDTALSIPNTNPIVLATSGSPAVDIWLNGVYRVILKDEDGNVLWDKDPVGGDSSDRQAYQAWVAGISYNIGDIVTGSNDRYYVSIVEPNINNDPISSPVSWTEFRLLRVYNANETYQVGTIVQDSSGLLWRAIAITAGSTPVLGSAFWAPASAGVDELRKLNYITTISGATTLAVGNYYYATGVGPFTLPDITLVTDKSTLIFGHDPDINPTIVAHTGQKITAASTGGTAQDYDDIVVNIGVSFSLVVDGGKWKVN